MKIDNLNKSEIETLIKAVAFLQANMDQELVNEFADSGYSILTSEYELIALEAKLEKYNSDLCEIAKTENILNSQIRDWRLSEGYKESELKPEHRGTYTLNIDRNKGTGQIFFSVYNQAFDEYPKDIIQSGLNGLIEIRDGFPAVSLGINPDENIVHVMSNNSNELAIIPEDDSGIRVWEPIKFCEANYKGLCFKVDDGGALMEARSALANRAFESYDFGKFQVKDDSGWNIDDTHWSKTVFFENEDGEVSIRGSFELTFSQNSTHIIGVTADVFESSDMLQSKSLCCAREIWNEFGDIPINDQDEIEEPFMGFTVGTDRFEIWRWFEKTYNCSITDLTGE